MIKERAITKWNSNQNGNKNSDNETEGGALVASGRAYQVTVLSSSPGIRWPLFFGITAEEPKFTHMLP